MVKASKGGQWERDVAKFLTNWLTGQSKEYYFWRSPGSGSIATVSASNMDLHGDIIPLKEEANQSICSSYSIECKNGYADASLDKHLKNNKNDTIKDFWMQAVQDAEKCVKLPMLIFKKKGSPVPWLGVCHTTWVKHINILGSLKFVHLRWDTSLPDCYLFDMKKFFNVITPKILQGV